MPGTRIGKVDGLSRRLDWKIEVDKNNENQVVVKDSWLCKLEEVVIDGLEVDIVEKIKKARGKDEKIVRIVEEIKKAKVKAIQEEEWKIEGELVLKEKKIYVSKDEELKVEIIWLHHDILVAGHEGKWKTVKLVTRNYWWPGVMREVRRYVEGCNLCQRIKNRIEEVVGKLKLGEVPEKLWIHISVDLIMKLPIVAGKNAILVVCNILLKITHFIAITEGTTAEGLVRLFRDNVWRLHGLPESVVLNRRLQFAVELTKELYKMLGIQTKLSTMFHLQTNRQT